MSALLTKTIPHEVEISLSGLELANLFWELDADEQAEFFNSLDFTSFVFQLQAVTDSKNLTNTGRSAMRRIGEYASPYNEST